MLTRLGSQETEQQAHTLPPGVMAHRCGASRRAVADRFKAQPCHAGSEEPLAFLRCSWLPRLRPQRPGHLPPSCCEHRELWESWCSLPLFPSLGMDSLLTCGGFLPKRCAISLISRRNILSGAPFLRCDQTRFNHIFPGVRSSQRGGLSTQWGLLVDN